MKISFGRGIILVRIRLGANLMNINYSRGAFERCARDKKLDGSRYKFWND